MSQWLDTIASSDDFEAVARAIEHFESHYEDTRKHLEIKGKVLVGVSAFIPTLTDTIYVAWSELKAICQILDLRKAAAIGKARKTYIEHYDRNLSATQVENYAKVDPTVIMISEICIQMEYVLDKWEGLSKGLERMSHQVRLIGEMRKAGMDETVI